MSALAIAVTLGVLQAALPKPVTEPSLPVLPTAVEIVRGARAGTASVAYDVREAYPASQTIGHLVDAMAKEGWRLAEVGGFKGSWPQPSDLPTRPGGRHDLPTHVWRGRWLGGGGREAEFRLTYSCPMETAGMHSVWVHVSGAAYGPKEAALRNAARRRILDQCEAGQTVSPECEK